MNIEKNVDSEFNLTGLKPVEPHSRDFIQNIINEAARTPQNIKKKSIFGDIFGFNAGFKPALSFASFALLAFIAGFIFEEYTAESDYSQSDIEEIVLYDNSEIL